LKKIILASGSPRRHALLSSIGVPHDVVPSTIDEVFDFTITASAAAEKLAREKAREVAQRVHFDLLIAADTIVVLEGELLAKPSNKIEAFEMLQKLSANTHEVITGVTLLTPSTERTFSVSTKVTFEQLTDSEIEAYVDTGSPMDKAGGYGIQDDLGSLFVKHINGDYYNVVGLPLQQVYSELKSVSPDITNMILRPKRFQPVS
jgi:septum formation protein